MMQHTTPVTHCTAHTARHPSQTCALSLWLPPTLHPPAACCAPQAWLYAPAGHWVPAPGCCCWQGPQGPWTPGCWCQRCPGWRRCHASNSNFQAPALTARWRLGPCPVAPHPAGPAACRLHSSMPTTSIRYANTTVHIKCIGCMLTAAAGLVISRATCSMKYTSCTYATFPCPCHYTPLPPPGPPRPAVRDLHQPGLAEQHAHGGAARTAQRQLVHLLPVGAREKESRLGFRVQDLGT
jgi:hypothetical protein